MVHSKLVAVYPALKEGDVLLFADETTEEMMNC